LIICWIRSGKNNSHEGAKKIRQGTKGQNFGQAEEAFKVAELVHHRRLIRISGFHSLLSPSAYAILSAS
jgi:diaminopimelate decarboxylase